MNGTYYLIVVRVLYSSVNDVMFKHKTDMHQKGGIDLDTYSWPLNKPKGFLVHLSSRINSLGGNLVKTC